MRQGGRVTNDFTDPLYMKGDSEFSMFRTSNDNKGGTIDYELTINWQPRARIQANYPTFTGGTFIHPGVLPPVRDARLQGISAGRYVPAANRLLPPAKISAGRFVPEANNLLPPVRDVRLQGWF